MVIIKPHRRVVVTTTFIKNRCLELFRYSLQYPLVCSECVNFADINAINDKQLVEVEIKMSSQDLHKEFDRTNASENKKSKHFKNYLQPEKYFGKNNNIIPNLFYLAVEASLEKEAMDLILRHNAKYGLILCHNYKKAEGYLQIRKPAIALHDFKPPERAYHLMTKRCTSEMIQQRIKVEEAALEYIDPPEMIRPKVVDSFFNELF